MSRILFKMEMPWNKHKSNHARLRPSSLGRRTGGGQIRLLLAKSGTLVVALIGPPGAGKLLLEATARQLRGVTGLAIIVANPAAERDAGRIERYCQQVEAVNASPNAGDSRGVTTHAIEGNRHRFHRIARRNHQTPDFGQDVTVTVLGVTGGDDKAAEYASLLSNSSTLVLTKAELQRHVVFDKGAFAWMFTESILTSSFWKCQLSKTPD